MRVRDAGVVVIGSGLAGLTATLEAAAAPALAPVVLLTKTAELAGGSSAAAQGGIAAAVGPGDDPEAHAADTVAAGAGLVDPAVALLVARDGAAAVRDLLARGLPFDRDTNGAPALGREGAHGAARILHAGGDATGRVLVAALAERVRAMPSVQVATGAFACDLVVADGRIAGVLAVDRDGFVWYRAARVVLATGGVGAIYRRSTNPPEATADGLALAARAGARLGDLEFVQFHPTALAADTADTPAAGWSPAPLLTEALRGAGAVLRDDRGRAFMADEHPAADLAPRDVVARAIGRRVAAGRSVLLDLRPALAASPDGFPTAVAACRAAGLDPFAMPVPVAPAAHYHMGGVITDTEGRTSIPGLWACGEVARTGVHGANRLASNSLLEALVFGRRAARDLAAAPGDVPASVVLTRPAVSGPEAAPAIAAVVAELRAVMATRAGLVRTAAGLRAAVNDLAALAERLAALPTRSPEAMGSGFGPDEVRRCGEARNMLLAARLIVAAALARPESRGAHWRDDDAASTADTVPAPARPPIGLAAGAGLVSPAVPG
ncbi:L-aspartate oxidase [Rhodoplanes serenus]|uniref:L-aspartate oxidase n=1 Tax=Rhodoplanes serenus TaxID=200615 RepID=A0A447CVX2_9BRAD|nr:L-aspartate oxidase [Rhodoplanes serenus]VCU09458.1 L-aspartate oxidase [Rhodoplanes serenus]